MAIEQQEVTIRCDFCLAYYKADKPVLKPGWQHVTVNGKKGLVACPREIVEQMVTAPSASEAMERFYGDAVRMAARDGKPVA